MSGNSKPFQRECAWCGDLFTARRETDNSCCLECSEQLSQAAEDLRIKKAEFRSVREEVEVLHERLCMVHLRVERQVKKLKRLGVKWRQAESDANKDEIEKRERLRARTLERLNVLLERVFKESTPKERRLESIERELTVLKKMIGDDSSLLDL